MLEEILKWVRIMQEQGMLSIFDRGILGVGEYNYWEEIQDSSYISMAV